MNIEKTFALPIGKNYIAFIIPIDLSLQIIPTVATPVLKLSLCGIFVHNLNIYSIESDTITIFNCIAFYVVVA